MRHANDGIHGCANFMAHVGQKFGLDLRGVLGDFLCAEEFLLRGFQSAIGGFQLLLSGNDLPFGSGEGFSLRTSLFKEALSFKVSGEKLGVHGNRGEKCIKEGLLAVGENRDGGEFEDAKEKVLIENRYEEDFAGGYRTHAGGDENRIIFLRRQVEHAAFEGGLADQPYPERELGGLSAAIEGETADATWTGVQFVHQIKSAV